jgi:hypothetical protein
MKYTKYFGLITNEKRVNLTSYIKNIQIGRLKIDAVAKTSFNTINKITAINSYKNYSR